MPPVRSLLVGPVPATSVQPMRTHPTMTGPGPLVFTATCPCGQEASWTATPADIGRPATTVVDCVHCFTPTIEERK